MTMTSFVEAMQGPSRRSVALREPVPETTKPSGEQPEGFGYNNEAATTTVPGAAEESSMQDHDNTPLAVRKVTSAYGATPDDWAMLADVAGLTADLLPVVSNPGARISSDSKLKALGKVPSLFNAAGEVVGIARWTDKISTPTNIDRWQQNPDLGICIQTRTVRALDVDIDLPDEVAEIREIIAKHLGNLPVRGRADSAKCLLAFTLPGAFTKVILKAKHGAIEFLADGQQFIAAGTHPKGARYEWEGGMPHDFPEVSVEAFEACMAELKHCFAVEEEVVYSAGAQLKSARRKTDANDDLADYLLATGWVLSESRDGRLNVTCPFEHEHSGPSADDTATQYMPAGVGGFEVGRFHCLHAHCANRDQGDYMEAVGYIAAQFDIVPTPDDEKGIEPLPAFVRKGDKIMATVENVTAACTSSRCIDMELVYDEFLDDLMVAPPGTNDQWRPLKNTDYTRMRCSLAQRDFAPVGRDLIKDAVALAAEYRKIDSAQLWLGKLEWDGVPRIDTFWSDYFGVEDSAYTRAVARYTWSALAGRIVQPGVKADMVPVLTGVQGQKKSSGLAAMCPSEEHFTTLRFSDKREDMIRVAKGRLVCEVAELQGLGTKDLEAIKAFVATQVDDWVPKHVERATRYPRRWLMFGTSNQREFLADETGERRWLPMLVTVEKTNSQAIKQVRDQLWAEGAAIFRQHGVMWEEAEHLAREVHKDFKVSDDWEEMIADWLSSGICFDDLDGGGAEEITNAAIFTQALRFQPCQIKTGNCKETKRVKAIMERLGWEMFSTTRDGRRLKLWHKVPVEGAA